jgi:16S rRNA pseudouridine516 synthase
MIRLDKFLSEASPYSRRESEKLIRRGAVTVNGETVSKPDAKVDEKAEVRINRRLIIYRKYIYLMLNKPQGFLSATEDKHDPVVVDLVPEELRHFKVFPVGRLDKDTEGLLLLTNDGNFDHALMSPRKQVVKRYFAILDKPAEAADCDMFAAGMDLGDFIAKPGKLEIDPDEPTHVFVEISEGKFHQVKRMCEKAGKTVVFLKRVAIGPLTLDETLLPGDCRELTQEEMDLLLR